MGIYWQEREFFWKHDNSEADFNRREGVCDTLKGTGAEIVWTVSRDEEIKLKYNITVTKKSGHRSGIR